MSLATSLFSSPPPQNLQGSAPTATAKAAPGTASSASSSTTSSADAIGSTFLSLLVQSCRTRTLPNPWTAPRWSAR